jgi:hypothetical protein
MKMRLTPAEKSIVEDVVRDCRAAASNEMSPSMRLVADEIAAERLEDEYGIVVDPRRLAKVA